MAMVGAPRGSLSDYDCNHYPNGSFRGCEKLFRNPYQHVNTTLEIRSRNKQRRGSYEQNVQQDRALKDRLDIFGHADVDKKIGH